MIRVLFSSVLMFMIMPCLVFSGEVQWVQMHFVNGKWELPTPPTGVIKNKEVFYKDYHRWCNYEDDAQACLSIVNARRRVKGLYPYIFDQNLADRALVCAKWRADNLCEIHIPGSDYAYSRTEPYMALCTGCGTCSNPTDFQTCAMYETDGRYCGVARVLGRDGQLYCHLFLR